MKKVSNKVGNENTTNERMKGASRIKDNDAMSKLKNSRYRPWIDYLAIEMKRLDSPHAERED